MTWWCVLWQVCVLIVCMFCRCRLLCRFNHLLRVMRKSLNDLKKAIKGLVVMSAQLEAMHKSFMFNMVPASWEAVAYPSLKPLGSWFEDL